MDANGERRVLRGGLQDELGYARQKKSPQFLLRRFIYYATVSEKRQMKMSQDFLFALAVSSSLATILVLLLAWFRLWREGRKGEFHQ